MKVEWLDEKCNKARLTRGWFKQEVALVRKRFVNEDSDWLYETPGPLDLQLQWCEFSRWLNAKRARTMKDRARERNWTPVTPPLTTARLIKDTARLIKEL